MSQPDKQVDVSVFRPVINLILTYYNARCAISTHVLSEARVIAGINVACASAEQYRQA